ncbi:Ribosomal RNA small subunit methyltransferase H, partial [Frankliniella fusca]
GNARCSAYGRFSVEAMCGAATSLMANATVVFVAGRAPWIGAFSARLPGAAYLFVGEPSDHVEWAIGSTRNVAVLAALPAAALGALVTSVKWPYASHVLLWTVAPDRSAVAVAAAVQEVGAAARPLFAARVHLLLSLPGGAAVLYLVSILHAEEPRPEIRELDRWSGSRWLHYPGYTLVPCDSWRPLTDNKTLPTFVWLPMQSVPDYDLVMKNFFFQLRRATPFQVLRPFGGNPGGENVALVERDMLWKTSHCHVDAAAHSWQLPVQPTFYLTTYSINMYQMYVVVASGLGLREPVGRPGMLLMWVGVVVSGLAVAAVLAAAARVRGGGCSAGSALLQALVPVVAQVSAHPAPAHRPLYGLWLLSCIFLYAVMQADMLANLTFEKPPSEVESLAELAQLGLPLAVPVYFNMIPLRYRNVRYFTMPHRVVLTHAVEHRNVAVLVDEARQHARAFSTNSLNIPDMLGTISTHRLGRKVLHVFKDNSRMPTSFMATSKGSPLMKPAQVTMGRLMASGILVHWVRTVQPQRDRDPDDLGYPQGSDCAAQCDAVI